MLRLNANNSLTTRNGEYAIEQNIQTQWSEKIE